MIASTCPVRRLQLQGWASGSGGGLALGTREKRREERTRKQQKGRGGGAVQSAGKDRGPRPQPAVRRHARRECRGRQRSQPSLPRAGKTNIGMLLASASVLLYVLDNNRGRPCFVRHRLSSPTAVSNHGTGYALRTRQARLVGEACDVPPGSARLGLALAASACLHWMPGCPTPRADTFSVACCRRPQWHSSDVTGPSEFDAAQRPTPGTQAGRHRAATPSPPAPKTKNPGARPRACSADAEAACSR